MTDRTFNMVFPLSWLYNISVMKTNDVKYRERMFAFLDILGFERIIHESKSNPGLIHKIAGILGRSKQIASSSLNAKLTILQVDPKVYTYRMFSDTSIIIGPYSSHDDMSFLAMWVMFYQYLMWKEEQIFVRGAIVCGDVYEDQGVVFGPALIDAYHLESHNEKASWPRILVDQSLLKKFTDSERSRDFYEFLRQDDDRLVYLDYLHEIFHLHLFAQSEKVTGKREQDLGSPFELFEEHKKAILEQIKNSLREENQTTREKILKKYEELSKYHNSTIQRLCQVANDLMVDTNIARELFAEQLESAKAKQSGKSYKLKYSAEEHPEQSDMLNILGSAMNNIISKEQEKNRISDETTIMSNPRILIDNRILNLQSLEILKAEIETETIEDICIQVPDELKTLEGKLRKSVIEINNFSRNV